MKLDEIRIQFILTSNWNKLRRPRHWVRLREALDELQRSFVADEGQIRGLSACLNALLQEVQVVVRGEKRFLVQELRKDAPCRPWGSVDY